MKRDKQRCQKCRLFMGYDFDCLEDLGKWKKDKFYKTRLFNKVWTEDNYMFSGGKLKILKRNEGNKIAPYPRLCIEEEKKIFSLNKHCFPYGYNVDGRYCKDCWEQFILPEIKKYLK